MLGSPGPVLASSVGTRNVWEFEEGVQGEAGRRETQPGAKLLLEEKSLTALEWVLFAAQQDVCD